jgi:hypothetical protein
LKDSRRGSGEDKLAAKVAGFETKNMIPMVLQTGHPPHYIHPRTSQLKSLTECLREARRLGRPVVFFPEVCMCFLFSWNGFLNPKVI